jgi:exodeoxyribonuclease V
MLTESQQRAYDVLLPFLTGETTHRSAVLTGVAGTGKSYLTGKIVIDLVSDGHRIAVAAPTNKAVRVIKEKVELQAGRSIGASFSSIHSLLGLRLIEHEDGNQSCQPLGEPTLGQFDVIVVDECSMIGDNLFKLIKAYQDDARVLFIGDPAQLPPVAEKEDVSPTFTESELKAALTEIVRQAEGSDIIRLSTHVRELPVRVTPSHLYPLLRDLDVRIAKGNRAMVLETARQAIERQEDARIIAYMNSTVVYYNKTLHALFHPGEEPFAVGERAIVHQQCEMVNEFGPVTLITNEEVTILEISPVEHPDFPQIRSWAVKVQTDLGDQYYGYVAHDAQGLEREVAERFDAWRKLKGQGRYEEAKMASASAWALRKGFAPLRHVYSCTSHKAQGSTFDTAIIDMENMDKMRSTFTFNRGLYVAVTRPRKFLYIIHE